MKNRRIIFLFFILFSGFLYAGGIVDTSTKTPIDYVNPPIGTREISKNFGMGDGTLTYNKDINNPLIGAQIFLEPGQTPEEIDRWFRVLKENNMNVCRIRMLESYMRKTDNSWDYTLFDNAFKSAEKYGIKIFATLFPYTEKTDIGGFKFPSNEEHLKSIANYIKVVVTHFKSYSSLFGWVLINEPGVGGNIPWNDFVSVKYEEWRRLHPKEEYTENGYPILVDLTDQYFLRDLSTWYLNWIASEIKKYDPQGHLHVNNHMIFNNCAEYNFPEWRKFLDSLGGSAHASWHFGYFSRDKYAVAMSANSEIMRSGAGNLPWLMTELQGGNNTYSAFNPFCPTKEEIAQWCWIVIGTEGKGMIFWTLNPRSSGIESGEWALLTFQDAPSDRLIAIADVAKIINKNSQLFMNAKEIDSGINILYVRESMWAEKALMRSFRQEYEARQEGGTMKSALAYFEALSETGINTNLKAFEEFDFSKDDYTSNTIILAHQISLPKDYVKKLENFVYKGGKLIIDGLTAFYDENLLNTMKTGFMFEKLFGGNISEYKVIDDLFYINIGGISLPAHLWQGFIYNVDSEIVSLYNNEPVATRNKFGKGEVLWIPSLVGLGGRIEDNYSPLITLLKKEIKSGIDNFPIIFKEQHKGMLMKSMKSGNNYITILINKNTRFQTVKLEMKKKLKPTIIYANKGGKAILNMVEISPEETIVILWN